MFPKNYKGLALIKLYGLKQAPFLVLVLEAVGGP